MGRKTGIFGVVFILAALVMAGYMRVPAFQEKLASITEEEFHEGNIYSDLKSVSVRLDEEILKGTDSFVIYLKNMDINEINLINSSLDGVFGSGESYQQVGMVGTAYKKVVITVKKTTNYYAYAAVVKNEPVPETETKARELYQVLKTVLDTCITEEMTDYEKELALHDYLITHCVYSEKEEQGPASDVYRAYGALVNHDAVCNGYAEAMQLMLLSAGVHSKFVIGTADGIDHAWNLVELDGKWYHLDTTWDDPRPDQGDDTLHPYFNVTDEIMAENHVWQREDYPKTEDMEYNYYVQNDAYFQDFMLYKDRAYTELVVNGSMRYEAVLKDYVIKEDDMRFIFEGNYLYNSVSWQTFGGGSYQVLVLRGE